LINKLMKNLGSSEVGDEEPSDNKVCIPPSCLPWAQNQSQHQERSVSDSEDEHQESSDGKVCISPSQLS
jgi:hypothetical protein